MNGSLIRRVVFWVVDFFNGSIVRKKYNDISKSFNKDYDNCVALSRILEHAIKTVPYYLGETAVNIKKFPVLSKLNYKGNYEGFQSSSFVDSKIYKMSTSGSTGIPFVVNQDYGKRKRNHADVIFYNKLCNQKLGDKFVFFRVWNESNRKKYFERKMQNILPFNILYLDEKTLDEIRSLLKKDKKITSALGYGSTYEMLGKHLLACGDTADMFCIKSLIKISELMGLETKKLLKKVLGCQVFDRYSNQECGIIAQTTDCSDIFYVNRASYYVELLKLDSDEAVAIGEVGRIVITDLYNYAMPIIRYDTGDLAINHKSLNGQVVEMKSIQGRQVDVIYDTQGKPLTPHTWSVYMWKFDKINQYQFIQNGKKEYLLKVIDNSSFYNEKEIDITLRNILGEDANIEIVFVDELPILASGKFKKTICNYVPNL